MKAILEWERDDVLNHRRTYKGLSGIEGYKKYLKDKSLIKPLLGDCVEDVLGKMVRRSWGYGIRTYMYFNDVYIVANPGDSLAKLLSNFWKVVEERDQKSKRSFRYKIFQREMEQRRREEEERKAEVQKWVSKEKMKVKLFKIFKYRKAQKLNQGSLYSKRIFSYAEEWSIGMQRDLKQGKTVSEVADEISRYVNYDGITGYMYSSAAKIISEFWKHGEEFRQWFNLHNQIREEGKKANKEGGILNTAILNFGAGK